MQLRLKYIHLLFHCLVNDKRLYEATRRKFRIVHIRVVLKLREIF